MSRPRGPMRWDAARLVPARRGRDVTIRESGKKECGCDITESWVVDHDWSCCPVRKGSCGNCTRGLLCSRCNHGIGYFEGRIHALQGAYNYLSGAKTPVAGRK